INTSSSAHISEKTLLKVWLSIINSKIDYYKQINNQFKNRSIWWLLDECGNIPKLEFLKTIISFGRGRNEFALPIFQSEPQMKQIYGDELIASCENKILFANDNVSLAKNISILSGLNEQELEYGRISKNLNLELENITNIPNGYLGLFSFKRNKNNKSFYLAPITYFYMLKNIRKNSKLKSNPKYLLSEYEQIISLDNEETKNLDQTNKITTTKKFKYWYLNIDSDLVLSSPDKSKCMQLLNQIRIDLEYFRFKEDINIKKLEKINENFTFLQKILNDELSNSLIFKFIWFAKCNRNIIYGKELSEMRYENEQDKTKEN
ncbi:MAG: TraM recognition domain-containing protein, partial [Ureaplasma sp.]|nr:TraM recognition domain-containing protein [Ureaplasma sp.]